MTVGEKYMKIRKLTTGESVPWIVGIDIDYFSKNYPEEIYENGIQCRDMIRLSKDL